MPIRPPPPTSSASRGFSFERFSSVSHHAVDTVKRLRTYLRGRGADLESLAADAQMLTAREWRAALVEQRNSGKLVYIEPVSSVNLKPDAFTPKVASTSLERHCLWMVASPSCSEPRPKRRTSYEMCRVHRSFPACFNRAYGRRNSDA
jgi:hypothetical protein